MQSWATASNVFHRPAGSKASHIPSPTPPVVPERREDQDPVLVSSHAFLPLPVRCYRRWILSVTSPTPVVKSHPLWTSPLPADGSPTAIAAMAFSPLVAAFAVSVAPVGGLRGSSTPPLRCRRSLSTAPPAALRLVTRMSTPPADGDSPPPASLSTAGKAACAAAFITFPTVAVSEYALLTTGCGLPPGPGGLIGAVEGIGYLAVAAVVVWSVATKVKTGKGLPAGPGGVVGAVEGLAWLLALGGLGAAAFVVWKFGGLPEAVPGAGSRCFPME